MKWFRKNNKKLMAVVVIVIMFGFVGGSALKFFLQDTGGGGNEVVAHYGDNKITVLDIQTARQELEMLRMLEADVMLRSIIEQMSRRPDLRALFLGELLFGEKTTSVQLMGLLRQTIRANDYRISLKQINDIYRGSLPSYMYWLLLKKEVEYVGLKVANEDAGRYLAAMLPKINKEATYSTRVGAIVNRQGIPEPQILSTFGKLLAVLEYARMVCSGEDITVEQIKHAASFEQQSTDVEFVRFDSSVFAESQEEPSEQQIAEHFEKYKSFVAGDVTDDNPYGFGYKLPDRVRLEYIAVKIRDVADIVTEPTPEDAERYYMTYKNTPQFQESVPADPCDPLSKPSERTKNYAEVAEQILTTLLDRKKISKTEEIIADARKLTESALGAIDREDKELTTEQFKELAGDYKATAEELSSKYEITVYSGQTGLLSAADIRQDAYLPALFVTGPSQSRVGLTQVVFAIDELQVSELGPFDVRKHRMFENITPIRDLGGRIVMMARVIEAQKTAEAESVNHTFSINTLNLKPPDPNTDKDEDVYSVRQAVVENLKILAAMDTTRSKANEFKNSIAELGWDDAIDKLNQLYGPSDANETDSNIPNVFTNQEKTFRLDKLNDLRRISPKSLEALVTQSSGNPAGQFSINMAKQEKRFMDLLYSLVPADANSLDTVPMVIEFAPDMSYYCLKSLSINRIYRNQYEQTKSVQVYREELIQSQSLSAVHFNPQNIEKRMAFKSVPRKEQQEQSSDANALTKTETSGES